MDIDNLFLSLSGLVMIILAHKVYQLEYGNAAVAVPSAIPPPYNCQKSREFLMGLMATKNAETFLQHYKAYLDKCLKEERVRVLQMSEFKTFLDAHLVEETDKLSFLTAYNTRLNKLKPEEIEFEALTISSSDQNIESNNLSSNSEVENPDIDTEDFSYRLPSVKRNARKLKKTLSFK